MHIFPYVHVVITILHVWFHESADSIDRGEHNLHPAGRQSLLVEKLLGEQGQMVVIVLPGNEGTQGKSWTRL